MALFAAAAMIGCGDGEGDRSVVPGGDSGTGTASSGGDTGAGAAGDGNGSAAAVDDRLRGDVFFEVLADPGDDDFDNAVYARASFVDPSSERLGNGSFTDETVRVGRCRIDRREPSAEMEPDGVADGEPTATGSEAAPARLSAGEALTLSTPEGTFGEFQRFGEQGEYRYSFDVEGGGAERPLPPQLVLDIPGDEFPAAAALAVPELDPMVLRAPAAGATVDADVTVEWEASDTGFGLVSVSFSSFSDDFRRGLGVYCDSPDNGAYALPPDVIRALAPLPADLPFPAEVSVSRSASALYELDRAVVEISVLSSSGRELAP